jgi:hypothetical protein
MAEADCLIGDSGRRPIAWLSAAIGVPIEPGGTK